MNDIVSSPVPGSIPRPSQSSCASALVVEDLVPYEVLAEQFRELEADLAAELATPVAEFADHTSAFPDTDPESPLLPGFETLTTADMFGCPPWCVYGQGHPHGDGFDPDEHTAPHRSTELRFSPNQAGAGIDQPGPAEISVQLERHRDLTAEPRLTLSIAVNGIEQYATLSLAEARTLHGTIANLLDDTDE